MPDSRSLSDRSERARLFVRDIEQDPGYEVDVFEPGEEVTIEPGTWEEFVPISEVERLRDVFERIKRQAAPRACRLQDGISAVWVLEMCESALSIDETNAPKET